MFFAFTGTLPSFPLPLLHKTLLLQVLSTSKEPANMELYYEVSRADKATVSTSIILSSL